MWLHTYPSGTKLEMKILIVKLNFEEHIIDRVAGKGPLWTFKLRSSATTNLSSLC